MAQGMNMGIVTLLFVIVSVLLGIAAFFFYILRRAAQLADGPHPELTAGSNRDEPALPQPISKSIP
jgi:F0F1-type ATP synthase assembly protein I